MKRLFHDIISFLKASRIPNLLVIGSAQYLAAIFLVSEYPDKYSNLTSFRFFILVVSTVMIAAGGYIINDYYDQKIDLVNRPHKVVVGTKLRRRKALFSHFLLTLGGISLGFMLDIKIGAIHILSSFFLWYYSNSLRRITLIGNIVIAFLTGITLLMVVVFLERSEVLIYAYALFAMAIVLIREVIKDMEDVKGDERFGIESIPVIFGIRGAKWFIYLVSIGSAGLLMYYLIKIDNWVVRFYFTALLPVFIYFLYRLIIADRQIHYKNLVRFTNVIIISGLISMILTKSWV